MSVPSGRLQFFALEATDYLERLGVIAARPTPPVGEELVRLTRALRGAALMAGLAPFAHAAQAVEQIAKGYRDGNLVWDTDRANEFGAIVTELRRLVNRATEWTDAEATAADALARRIGDPAGRGKPASIAGPADDEIQPSVRAFVGREGAQIAGTLEHAAQAVELGQPGETADVLLHRLQPLRGLAALPRLSPLPEFLDAIELAVRSLRDAAPPPASPATLRKVAQAVGILAREVADSGAAPASHETVVAGAEALFDTFGSEDDVVAIASLFRADDPRPIVSRGEVPEPAAPADLQIELTSLADRFRQGADQLRAAPSQAVRFLTLYSLSTHLAPLTRDAHRERPVLGGLLDAVRGAVKSKAAVGSPDAFAGYLQRAAEELSTVAGSRNAILLADQLEGIIVGLAALPPRAAPPPVATQPPEDDVVPIESLAPDEPATSLSTFEQSFSTYHALLRTPAREPVAVPEREFEADVLPIEIFLYRGRRALERADVVRRDLTVALKSDRPFVEVEPLVSELIDLVPLALAE
jgi:hypothetical protein